MDKKRALPFGTWPSRITPDLTGNLREFSELSWSEDGCLLWVERQSNMSSLMAWDPQSTDIINLSGNINVGGGIMYGGGSYTVCRDQIVFIEKKTHQLYLISGFNSDPEHIKSSPHPKSSPRISPFGSILAYIESEGKEESVKFLDLPLDQGPETIVSGFDFYNYLRWHPDGTHLGWMSWNHPRMPWEEAYINLRELSPNSGNLPDDKSNSILIKFDNVCTLQPEFSPDGQFLAYISDKTGWWQINLLHLKSKDIKQLTKSTADHALPPWLQNQCFYGFGPDSKQIYFIRNQQGFGSLWQINLTGFAENQIKLDDKYTWMEALAVSSKEDLIALVASGGRTPPQIIITNPEGNYHVIRRAGDREIDPDLFSRPEAISWQDPQGHSVHGLFYQPHHPFYSADGKPPLLIIIHSGPTRQKYAEFQPRTQYFTSRGYAVLEINYRGSTGYGRDYWEALKGRWGVLEVEDVYQAALSLSDQGLIDKNRIALLGSSSGGLTVFQALVKYPGVFKAGISLYGIVNHLTLLKNPPKFEQYYSEWLIGPYPENAQLYEDRSPVFFAGNIKDPLIIFQGGQDPIVPQDQAEQIVNALESNQTSFEYHLYPDEGHSFKKAANVSDFYQKIEAFLLKYVING